MAKPKPRERDDLLRPAAAEGQEAARAAILTAMPSFERLVEVVDRCLIVGGVLDAE